MRGGRLAGRMDDIASLASSDSGKWEWRIAGSEKSISRSSSSEALRETQLSSVNVRELRLDRKSVV